MKLLYFAWMRERIGCSEEELKKPENIHTVAQLIDHLKQQGTGYDEAFENNMFIRVAINETYADFDAVIKDGDEIAFFPPVTGG